MSVWKIYVATWRRYWHAAKYFKFAFIQWKAYINIFIIPSVLSEAKLITPLSIWPWFLQRCLIFYKGRYKWKIVCTAFVNSHTYCAKSALQYRDSRRFLCIFQKASPLKFTFSESWHIDVKQPIRFYLKNTFHLYTCPKL